MKKYVIFLLYTLLVAPLIAQTDSLKSLPTSEGGLVKWLDFKEAQELNKKQPKPFLIDVYTDWCGWCKHMMKTTYSDPGIANYVNTYFYPIKFDAETKDTIEYNGVTYKSTGTDKRATHELALKLLGTSLSYPSALFVSNNFQFNLLSQGYLESNAIEPLLVFTTENVYRNSDYEEFKINFNKTFYDTTKTTSVVKWYSMNEALELQKTKPKKIIVDIYTDFCNSCKVVNKTTFSNDSLAKYINEHFYLVGFNAQLNDTIVFNGVSFPGGTATNSPFHSLALALTQNRLDLPSLVFLNEDLQIMDLIPFYLSGKTANPIVHYFGSNDYKTIKWQDFQKKWQKTNTH